jgi:hypothetical protein
MAEGGDAPATLIGSREPVMVGSTGVRLTPNSQGTRTSEEHASRESAFRARDGIEEVLHLGRSDWCRIPPAGPRRPGQRPPRLGFGGSCRVAIRAAFKVGSTRSPRL